MSNQHDDNAWQRKDAHLDLAKQDLALTPQAQHPLDAVQLPHAALPEVNLADVSTSTTFLGRKLSMPLLITGMTGGTERADRINLALAEIAAEAGLALGVGSQRAGLAIGRSQKALRSAIKTMPLIGNLGGVQLARPQGLDLALRAIDDLQADALAIHLNPLQEATQIEGETDWRGVCAAIEALLSKAPVPIMVKEVGAGLHPNMARQLAAVGVPILDVAGMGGTNWTRIEAARYSPAEAYNQQRIAPFLDWGHNTADLLPSVRAACPDTMLIGSGGVRHGLDIARIIALGADLAGMAGPILKTLEPETGTFDQGALMTSCQIWQEQLQLALFLTGSANISQFQRLKR